MTNQNGHRPNDAPDTIGNGVEKATWTTKRGLAQMLKGGVIMDVLTPADESNHIDKHAFRVPFVCGCRNLGEALRRLNEGAAMIRTKGEAGTGNVVEAVRHQRAVQAQIRRLAGLRGDELFAVAK